MFPDWKAIGSHGTGWLSQGALQSSTTPHVDLPHIDLPRVSSEELSSIEGTSMQFPNSLHSATPLVSMADLQQSRGAPHSIHGRNADIMLSEPLACFVPPHPRGLRLASQPTRTSKHAAEDRFAD
ncbi:hypothetical protein BOTBODRAFT_173378 [Botryobasidium botryosum FD-172 SS1]|uniref:Uncharacterized protein n=1 Tax=Botryobasidium botryosum (strain FD-172 SS1) TaxID=930990 RepID=A0A067MW33_BOTB1|nr:hypothetical protein BOTBODRAFT_173378 [Botryobasidium botryosum FD-172 SS1]